MDSDAAGASMDSEEAAGAAFMDSEAGQLAAAPAPSHELVRQLRFPPGFRFVPTEEELVDVYLRCKVEGRQPPLDVVNEVVLLDWQPGRLVEAYKAYGEDRWYFFTRRQPSSSNKEKEPSRQVSVPGVTATWKATGSLTLIRRRSISKGGGGDGRVVIGTKRVLIYHSSDAEEDDKWSMHEYVLADNAQIGQYALCSIQRKQRSDDTEHLQLTTTTGQQQAAGGVGTGSSSSSSKRNKSKATVNRGPAGNDETTTSKRKKNTTASASSAAQAEAAQRQQRRQRQRNVHVPPQQPPLLTPLIIKEDHHQAPPPLQQEPSPLGWYAPPPPPTTTTMSLPSVAPLQQQQQQQQQQQVYLSSDGNLMQRIGLGVSAPMSSAGQTPQQQEPLPLVAYEQMSLPSSDPLQQHVYMSSDGNHQYHLGVPASSMTMSLPSVSVPLQQQEYLSSDGNHQYHHLGVSTSSMAMSLPTVSMPLQQQEYLSSDGNHYQYPRLGVSTSSMTMSLPSVSVPLQQQEYLSSDGNHYQYHRLGVSAPLIAGPALDRGYKEQLWSVLWSHQPLSSSAGIDVDAAHQYQQPHHHQLESYGSLDQLDYLRQPVHDDALFWDNTTTTTQNDDDNNNSWELGQVQLLSQQRDEDDAIRALQQHHACTPPPPDQQGFTL